MTKWKTEPLLEPLEATELNTGKWVVRPKGCLGTMGWIEGKAWTARYVEASSAKEALEIVRCGDD